MSVYVTEFSRGFTFDGIQYKGQLGADTDAELNAIAKTLGLHRRSLSLRSDGFSTDTFFITPPEINTACYRENCTKVSEEEFYTYFKHRCCANCEHYQPNSAGCRGGVKNGRCGGFLNDTTSADMFCDGFKTKRNSEESL